MRKEPKQVPVMGYLRGLQIIIYLLLGIGYVVDYFFPFDTVCDRYLEEAEETIEIPYGVIAHKYEGFENYYLKIETQDSLHKLMFNDQYVQAWWRFIEIGDTIVKEKGSLTFQIRRENKDKSFMITCREE